MVVKRLGYRHPPFPWGRTPRWGSTARRWGMPRETCSAGRGQWHRQWLSARARCWRIGCSCWRVEGWSWVTWLGKLVFCSCLLCWSYGGSVQKISPTRFPRRVYKWNLCCPLDSAMRAHSTQFFRTVIGKQSLDEGLIDPWAKGPIVGSTLAAEPMARRRKQNPFFKWNQQLETWENLPKSKAQAYKKSLEGLDHYMSNVS